MRRRALAVALSGVFLAGASFTAHREVDAGNRALQAGDPARAASHYQSALAEHPDDPAVRYDLGTAHLAAGDLDPAVDELSHAAAGAEGPLKSRADYNLGNALLARGTRQGPQGKADLQGAVQAYRRAVAADPDDADARRNLQLAATRLASLTEPPPRNGQQGQPQQQGQQGEQGQQGPPGGSPQSGQQGGKPQAGQHGEKPQAGQQAGAQGAKPGPEKGSETGAQAGRKGEDGRDRQASGEGAGAEGKDAEKGGPQAAQADGQPGDAGGDADARAGAGKPLPDDVARVLSGLRRQEAATLKQALRNSLGAPQPEDKDW